MVRGLECLCVTVMSGSQLLLRRVPSVLLLSHLLAPLVLLPPHALAGGEVTVRRRVWGRGAWVGLAPVRRMPWATGALFSCSGIQCDTPWVGAVGGGEAPCQACL